MQKQKKQIIFNFDIAKMSARMFLIWQNFQSYQKYFRKNLIILLILSLVVANIPLGKITKVKAGPGGGGYTGPVARAIYDFNTSDKVYSDWASVGGSTAWTTSSFSSMPTSGQIGLEFDGSDASGGITRLCYYIKTQGPNDEAPSTSVCVGNGVESQQSGIDPAGPAVQGSDTNYILVGVSAEYNSDYAPIGKVRLTFTASNNAQAIDATVGDNAGEFLTPNNTQDGQGGFNNVTIKLELLESNYINVSHSLTSYVKSESANHTIVLIQGSDEVGSGESIQINLGGSSFDTANIVYSDVDLYYGANYSQVVNSCSSECSNATLAASAGAATWGVSNSSGTITLSFPTSSGTNIKVYDWIRIEIGTQTGGNNQIVNPSTSGSKQVTLTSASHANIYNISITDSAPAYSGNVGNLYQASITIAGEIKTFIAAHADTENSATTDVIVVVDSTGLAASDKIAVVDGTDVYVYTISSISGNSITLTGNITVDHEKGDKVYLVDDATSGLELQFDFTNQTAIPSLQTVQFDFDYLDDNTFTGDSGAMTGATVNGEVGLTGGALTVVDAEVVEYAKASGTWNLSAATSISFDFADMQLPLDDDAANNEWPAKVSLIDSDGATIDSAVLFFSIQTGVFVEGQVNSSLTYNIAAGTNPTGGTVTAGSIDWGQLSNETLTTNQIVTVSSNLANGYTVYANGDAALTSENSSDDKTIAAHSGSNASPAAWGIGGGTGAYGYHSSDEALGTGTTTRFSTADTFAAFPGDGNSNNVEVFYDADTTTGATNDDDGYHSMDLKIQVSSTQPAGSYIGNFNYAIIPVW